MSAAFDADLAPGQRLAQLRQTQGLSQRKVAELSGLTHSAISTIEQNKVSPAVSTLQKLLKVYGLSLSEFFAEPVPPKRNKVVINPEELLEIGSQGVSFKLVHNGNRKRALGFLIESYAPGTSTGGNLKHQGEEVGTVLEGEIELTVDGECYSLRAGQSYVIDTGLPHTFTNISDRECRIISAHTPANL
ncbi:HTH-type transcriptional regulator PuuR [Oceanisphaera psychrotolerans]|uniref:Transcriptional regulator n=1 Tax=Oceanisphaera psychrotolerans TaxID=1414654 RepID=A0A1J4QEN8_9GAMM|nr:HTH-type transcriptional regulator PuuR [Oceanisphaera psychrotolerans]OIN12243.1 transcriptional regulator [Oceanisphaera psychrotolerans]